MAEDYLKLISLDLLVLRIINGVFSSTNIVVFKCKSEMLFVSFLYTLGKEVTAELSSWIYISGQVNEKGYTLIYTLEFILGAIKFYFHFYFYF